MRRLEEIIRSRFPRETGMAPAGVTRWGLRWHGRDGSSTRGYRWGRPGEWSVAPGACIADGYPCANDGRGGLHIAKLPAAMIRGAHDVLAIVGWCPGDVMGEDHLKVRVSRAWIAVQLPGWGELLRGADLRGADLEGAHLRGADLRVADMRGAYLRGADLRGAYLEGAYLRDADFEGAYLRGADLRVADMRGAYLRGADLEGAYLGGAYLGGAYLGGAELRGADLEGAYLWGADLGGAFRASRDHAIPGWRVVGDALEREWRLAGDLLERDR